MCSQTLHNFMKDGKKIIAATTNYKYNYLSVSFNVYNIILEQH